MMVRYDIQQPGLTVKQIADNIYAVDFGLSMFDGENSRCIISTLSHSSPDREFNFYTLASPVSDAYQASMIALQLNTDIFPKDFEKEAFRVRPGEQKLANERVFCFNQYIISKLDKLIKAGNIHELFENDYGM